MKITSTEFRQNAGLHQEAALQSPVTITKNGHPHTILFSAVLFEALIKGRITRRIEDLDDGTLKAIADSAVPAEYASLDELLED